MDVIHETKDGLGLSREHRSIPVYNPSTGERLYELPLADAHAINETVATAKRAAREWGAASQAKRLQVIFRMRELIVQNTAALALEIGRESGKTIADATGEVGRGLEAVEFATNFAHVTKGEYSRNVGGDIDVFSVREPVGIVACISPFNFPVMVPLMMSTMAIACGNAVIVKPSEKVPGAARLLGELWQKARLPDGVWNVVNGDRHAVDAILEHPDIAAISFVGSTPVGEYIYQKGSAHNKRVAAYTGGKNHMIVMPDADLDAAATAFVSAGYGSSSQRCMAVSLLVTVGEDTATRLRELVAAKISALKVGAFDDPGADFGPLVSSDAKRQVEKAMQAAIEAGAQVVIDGRGAVPQGLERGYFTGPSLLDGISPDMDFYKEEVFGPVRGIMRTSSLDEAIRITNGHEYGNGAVIFTRSGQAAHTFIRDVKAGMIGVNVAVPVPAGHHNFGGLRRSKFGDAHMFGPDAARFYTNMKTVSQRWPDEEEGAGVSMAFPSNASSG
jgi:malonate-semialdehyde dehydrogenase (acetylating)/methylmalonate-semialdehyde dehydrogenase